MTSVEKEDLDDTLIKDVPSPYSSIIGESCFNDVFCQLSPLSDSGDSGISSCHSPYGSSGFHESNVSSPLNEVVVEEPLVLEQEPQVAYSNINLQSFENPSDLLAELANDIVEECNDSFTADLIPGLNTFELSTYELRNNISTVFNEEKSVENVEINEVSFIEENKLSPDIVQEVKVSEGNSYDAKPVEILPQPVNMVTSNQKIFLVKAEPVRSKPYPKTKPAGQKTSHQKEKKKHQNRNAATRYRNKKKDELDKLFGEASELEDSNKELQDKVTSLTKEIDYLKGLMLDVIKAKLARSNSQQS